MALSAKNGVLLSAVSAVNAIAKAAIAALNGIALGAGGGGIFDDFNDNSKDGTKWAATTVIIIPAANLGGAANETGGQLAVGSFAAYLDANGYSSFNTANNLTAGHVQAQLVAVPDACAAYLAVQTTGNGGEQAYWEITNQFGTTTISAYYNNTGTPGTTYSATYNATTDAFFRVRCAGGDWFWETAPDAGGGVPGAWTVRRQRSVDAGTPAPHWSPTSTTFALYGMSLGSTTGTVVWDNCDRDNTP